MSAGLGASRAGVGFDHDPALDARRAGGISGDGSHSGFLLKLALRIVGGYQLGESM